VIEEETVDPITSPGSRRTIARHAITLDENARPPVERRRKDQPAHRAENVAHWSTTARSSNTARLAIASAASPRKVDDLIMNTPADGLIGRPTVKPTNSVPRARAAW